MTVTLYDERGAVVRSTDDNVEPGTTDPRVRERFGATLLYIDGDRGVVGAYCKAAGADHPVQRHAEGEADPLAPEPLRAFLEDVADVLGKAGTDPRALAGTDPDDTHRPFALLADDGSQEVTTEDKEGLDRILELLNADTPVDLAVDGDGYDEAVEVFELLAGQLAPDGHSVALTTHGRVAALDDVDVVVRPDKGGSGVESQKVRVPARRPVTFVFTDSTAALVQKHRVEAAAENLADAIQGAAEAKVDKSTVYDRVRAGLRSVDGDVLRAQDKAGIGLKWLATGLAVGIAIGFAFRRSLYVVESFYWSNPELAQLIAAGIGAVVLLVGVYSLTRRTQGRLNRSATGGVAVSLSFPRMLLAISLLLLGLLVVVSLVT